MDLLFNLLSSPPNLSLPYFIFFLSNLFVNTFPGPGLHSLPAANGQFCPMGSELGAFVYAVFSAWDTPTSIPMPENI